MVPTKVVGLIVSKHATDEPSEKGHHLQIYQ